MLLCFLDSDMYSRFGCQIVQSLYSLLDVGVLVLLHPALSWILFWMLNGNNVSRVINYTYIEIQDAKNAKIYAFVTLMLTIPAFFCRHFMFTIPVFLLSRWMFKKKCLVDEDKLCTPLRIIESVCVSKRQRYFSRTIDLRDEIEDWISDTSWRETADTFTATTDALCISELGDLIVVGSCFSDRK